MKKKGMPVPPLPPPAPPPPLQMRGHGPGSLMSPQMQSLQTSLQQLGSLHINGKLMPSLTKQHRRSNSGDMSKLHDLAKEEEAALKSLTKLEGQKDSDSISYMCDLSQRGSSQGILKIENDSTVMSDNGSLENNVKASCDTVDCMKHGLNQSSEKPSVDFYVPTNVQTPVTEQPLHVMTSQPGLYPTHPYSYSFPYTTTPTSSPYAQAGFGGHGYFSYPQFIPHCVAMMHSNSSSLLAKSGAAQPVVTTAIQATTVPVDSNSVPAISSSQYTSSLSPPQPWTTLAKCLS